MNTPDSFSPLSLSAIEEISKANLTTILGEKKVEFSHLETIINGGSSRNFYRLYYSSRSKEGEKINSLIFIHYNPQKEENLLYATQAQKLRKLGIKVAKPLYHLPEEGLLWMEDLGKTLLWHHRHDPWEKKGPLYRNALQKILLLHSLPLEQIKAINLPLNPPFNEQLYIWEQTYFCQHALGRLFGYSEKEQTDFLHDPEQKKLIATLCQLPQQLIHRDFQSQNIMVQQQECYFIDFQGMRLGSGLYDLASLLWDPYVPLTASERQELVATYRELLEEQAPTCPLARLPNFEHQLALIAVERLMQALGAYGYIVHQRGKKTFLKHVQPALQNLHEILQNLPADCCSYLRQIIAQISSKNFYEKTQYS